MVAGAAFAYQRGYFTKVAGALRNRTMTYSALHAYGYGDDDDDDMNLINGGALNDDDTVRALIIPTLPAR